ncbi:MAG: phage holin family protein [Anaerolineaceae bacterium]|jgi:putative membrane protein|nr:phage holin family protein [Anaerolineaceae bacterium]MDD4041936.1 phage holin family protein [Anaerolineaceae bacterium]MDD4578137.1 phage holin family protein [Anaerolineaceae bacterium]
MNLLKRWLVIMLAVFVAAWIVPGIHVDGNGWATYAIMAAVLALLNAILLPILKTLSCGLIVLTLGLFSLLLNTAMFMLSSNIAQAWFGAGYLVDNWWSAFLGSLIVSIATMIFANDKSSRRDRDDD